LHFNVESIMELNDKVMLLRGLTRIGANGPRFNSLGICANVAIPMAHLDYLQNLMVCWPEGASRYWPVEGSPAAYFDNTRKWDVNTPFGAKRYRLLAWLIHEITKEIDDELRQSA